MVANEFSNESVTKFKGYYFYRHLSTTDLSVVPHQLRRRIAFKKQLCATGMMPLLEIGTLSDEPDPEQVEDETQLLDVMSMDAIAEWRAHLGTWQQQRCNNRGYPILVMVGDLELADKFLAKLTRVCLHLIRNQSEYDICFIGRSFTDESEACAVEELDTAYEEYEDDEEGIPRTVLVRASRRARHCMQAYLLNPLSIEKFMRLFSLEFMAENTTRCAKGLDIDRAVQGFIDCGEIRAVASRRRLVYRMDNLFNPLP